MFSSPCGGHRDLRAFPTRRSSDLDPPEVAVGEVARLVARRRHRALEPRDRLVVAALLDQVGADVVVGVSELWIDRDRLLEIGRAHVRTPVTVKPRMPSSA